MTGNGYPRKKIVTQTTDKKMVWEDLKSRGIENQVTCMGGSDRMMSSETWTVKQTRASDFEQAAGKKVGFDATSPRFNFNQIFHGQSLKFEVPGPGQYREEHQGAFKERPRTFQHARSQGRHANIGIVFNTSEKRFKPKGQNSY